MVAVCVLCFFSMASWVGLHSVIMALWRFLVFWLYSLIVPLSLFTRIFDYSSNYITTINGNSLILLYVRAQYF